MRDDELYIAIDLGAGSGRVFLAGVSPGELLIEEVRRFRYPPQRRAGHLRWDLGLIVAEIRAGLQEAVARTRAAGRRLRSIGIDSWGVDYGLVNRRGELIDDPICYRDERTEGVMDRVFARMSRAEIFARTGIQFLPINTLFQLVAHAAEGLPADAARLLLIPDLIALQLTGRAVTEFTNATTTQMVSAASGLWDEELIDRLDLPVRLFGDIVQAGATVAPLSTAAAATGLEGVQVVAVATHDTASAVAGTPLEAGWAYVSSGTWSLVGVELEHPRLDAAVARGNFTNEGGAFGTTRFLKNVMGLWLLESCRAAWERAGVEVTYAKLLEGVAAREDSPGVVFPDDFRFLNPPVMEAAIAAQMVETGQAPPVDPIAIAGVILDSLALRYASVVRSIGAVTGCAIRGVRIVGGGSRNAYLNQATADATGLPVVAGPVEATVIGNASVQAIAAGAFLSLADVRRHVAARTEGMTFMPRHAREWHTLTERYMEIESRYEGISA
jgi:rhamnulokinase